MFGRGGPPAAARARLESGERVLAWAESTDGAPVVATNRGLWWPGSGSDAGVSERFDWHLIAKAVWAEDGLTLTPSLIEDDLILVEQPPVRVDLREQRKLPSVVRARVEASVAQSHEVRLDGGFARVVGRRIAGVDGLSWWARLDAGTPDTAYVRAQVSEIIERLRAEQAQRLRDL